MAYMNQERKASIAAKLKLVVPKGWKYSLRVRNRSTIVMTVSQAPVDVIAIARASNPERDYSDAHGVDVNPYHYRSQFKADPKFVEVMDGIFNAMNDGNWDKSDLMTDYFNVGWYVDMDFGTWDKAFTNTAD